MYKQGYFEEILYTMIFRLYMVGFRIFGVFDGELVSSCGSSSFIIDSFLYKLKDKRINQPGHHLV